MKNRIILANESLPLLGGDLGVDHTNDKNYIKLT